MEINEVARTLMGLMMKPVPGDTKVARVAFAALELAGESGEVANQAKKMLRDDGGVLFDDRCEAIMDELGDSLFAIALTCQEMGTTIEAVADMEFAKLRKKRQEAGMA